jgi:putative phage-type endonuclease
VIDAEEARRTAWLLDRRTAITASDVGGILGVSPWTSPMDVFLDKQGMRTVETTERMKWGLKLQRAILEEYAERVAQPIELSDPYSLVRFPGWEHLGASLDARWAEGDRRPVDAKNVGFKTKEWGEPGTGDVPYSYALQLHVQMMVCGAQCADLAVLFGGNTLAIYHVVRDAEIDEIILSAAKGFWHDHIVSGMPPPVDGTSATPAPGSGQPTSARPRC